MTSDETSWAHHLKRGEKGRKMCDNCQKDPFDLHSFTSTWHTSKHKHNIWNVKKTQMEHNKPHTFV